MIGEKLNQLILEANMTAYMLSKLTGIGQDALSLYRNNKRSPGATNLKKLSKAFGVSVDELLF